MTSKGSRLTLIGLILLMPILLWVTKLEPMQSMSAFAFATNAFFYRAMHVLGSWLFIIEGQKFNRKWDLAAGISMGLILIFDMYNTLWAHNGFTVLTMALANVSMIYYADKKHRPAAIVLAGIADMFFILGLTTDVHLFLAEMVAMVCIAVSRARRAIFGPNY